MDAESYMSLRQKFILSYSVICIVHWLLGIGDRNLANTLVCQNTGQAIGIDFGYSFDVSTRNCPIPELIPFRLTPQIVNLIEPLGETGFIEYTMIHTLRALRERKHIVLSAMDVFINEPAVGWTIKAQNRAKENDTSITNEFIPSEKIMNAKKKLEGCNPIMIAMQELQEGFFKSDGDVLQAYCNAACGEKQHNIRKRLPFDGLSVEQQVQCLIDQATDYNILGRTFDGFEPWV